MNRDDPLVAGILLAFLLTIAISVYLANLLWTVIAPREPGAPPIPRR